MTQEIKDMPTDTACACCKVRPKFYQHKKGMCKNCFNFITKELDPLDAIVIITDLKNRKSTSKKDKEKYELLLDYWVMLFESGHNGFYLKAYHKDTQNKKEAIKELLT